MRRLTLTAGLVGSSLALWAALPVLGTSAPTAAELGSKISKTQGKIEYRKGKEKVLTRDIATYSDRVDSLSARVATLSMKQGALETDLNAKQATLNETQTQLRSERARLGRLQRRLAQVRVTLAARLVEQYKNGKPDLTSVVLESDGFNQLLEKGEYLNRLAAEDQKIIKIVASAKTDATSTEKRLSTLESRQQKVTAAVAARRNQIVQVKSNVASTEATVRAARNGKRALLSKVKTSRKDLEEDLATMQEQQAKISGALNGARGLAPIKQGNGRFIWPVTGVLTSGFCESRAWESCHPGIDIAVPTGTPIRAAAAGRVALAGWVGGYGNYTCIQHTSSLSTCYGHQSKLGVTVGQQVKQGQVIGLSGSTGHSTGPHVHFEVRINGAVTNPMNYL